MSRTSILSILRAMLSLAVLPSAASVAQAQIAVVDPSNLVQNALTAARTLQQINNQVTQITNQIRQLENDAKNLSRLGERFAPELVAQFHEMDALIGETRGIALEVGETREALQTLFSGNYRGTDFARRAQIAARQIDAARSALQGSLLIQAKVTEQLHGDEDMLQRMSAASSNATGALSAQQATNEFLAFQVGQSMRLQTLLAADTRAAALEQAREMEIRAEGRAQREHFFSGAANAHPGVKPWN